MDEIHLWILRMEWTAMDSSSAWSPQNDWRRSVPAIVRLRQKIGDLVERAGNEIDELKLRDRTQTGESRAESSIHNGSLGDRSVDHALGAEAVNQSFRDLEGSAINTDVFANAKDRGVA